MIAAYGSLMASDGDRGDPDRAERRKLTDRAKDILMDRHGLSEQDAWHFLQRQAMQNRRRVQDIAQRVIDGDLP